MEMDSKDQNLDTNKTNPFLTILIHFHWILEDIVMRINQLPIFFHRSWSALTRSTLLKRFSRNWFILSELGNLPAIPEITISSPDSIPFHDLYVDVPSISNYFKLFFGQSRKFCVLYVLIFFYLTHIYQLHLDLLFAVSLWYHCAFVKEKWFCLP